jgi:hypothetical protein
MEGLVGFVQAVPILGRLEAYEDDSDPFKESAIVEMRRILESRGGAFVVHR